MGRPAEGRVYGRFVQKLDFVRHEAEAVPLNEAELSWRRDDAEQARACTVRRSAGYGWI